MLAAVVCLMLIHRQLALAGHATCHKIHKMIALHCVFVQCPSVFQHPVACTVPCVGVFSAGADLKERAGMTQQEAWECVSLLRRTFSDLAALPMPTIAAVDGLALGGGAELALACDLRVVSKNAVFAFPETHLGIIPGAGGTQRLARAVGESRAKQLVFTAARVSGVDAVAMGLAEELAEETGQAGVSSCSSQTGAGAGSAEGGVSAGAPAYARALVLAAEIRKAAPLALRQAKVLCQLLLHGVQRFAMACQVHTF